MNASFQGLGFLGTPSSQAWAVSADGSVVVGQVTNPNSIYHLPEAFRWTSTGGMVGLPYNAQSYAYGVSADGSMLVGTATTANGYGQAAAWTTSSGWVYLSPVPDDGSIAVAASADGSVVVGYWPDQAFRWTSAGGMVGLGFLSGGSRSYANAVSADGSIVVGGAYYDTTSDPQAFRWTSATGIVGLGFLTGAYRSVATGITPDGSVVVGTCATGVPLNQEAFRWTSTGGMIGLGYAPGESASAARGVSADGSLVVGYSWTGNLSNMEACVWDSGHGMRSLQDTLVNEYGLDLTGWTLRQATAISADGSTIVGYGRDPNGNTEAWVAQIPEPTTWEFLALAGILLLLCRPTVRILIVEGVKATQRTL